MTGELSLFGGLEAADVPESPRCPACGGITETGTECRRCRDRGISATQLDWSGSERPTYRERRLAKAERLREWAEKRDAKSDAAYSAARATADTIPMGQPILVGHHSERSDRNRRDRMARNFDRSFEHTKKAANFRSRADGIEAAAERAIYSDDPDAVEALRARIAELEAERDGIKAYNKSCKAGTPDPSLLVGAWRDKLESYLRHWPGGAPADGSMPSGATKNLSANLNRNRKRLAELER